MTQFDTLIIKLSNLRLNSEKSGKKLHWSKSYIKCDW